jgi:DNA-binding CsgD family transcriptional regulator
MHEHHLVGSSEMARNRIWTGVPETDAGVPWDAHDTEVDRALCVLMLALRRPHERGKIREAASMAIDVSRRSRNAPAEYFALRALLEECRAEAYFGRALEIARELRAAGEPETIDDEIELSIALDDVEQSASSLNRQRAGGMAAARHLMAFGSLLEAERVTREIVRDGALSGTKSPSIDARLTLARIAQLKGDLPLARRELVSNEIFEDVSENVRLDLAFARASFAQSEGDIVRALMRFQQIVDRTSASGHLHRWLPEWLVEGTRCAITGGDVTLARKIALFAETIHRRTPESASFAAVASQTRGLAESDIALLGQAKKLCQTSPRPLLRAQAALDYGRTLLGQGMHDAAVVALDEAWERFATIGARGYALSIQRLLSGSGVRRRKWLTAANRPLEGWGALTDTEQRVAHLIGSGHTNKSAASKLGSTVNTVSSHARSIFGKLGIRSGYYTALVHGLGAAKIADYAAAERFFVECASLAPVDPVDVWFFRGAIANSRGDVGLARQQWAASISRLRYGSGVVPRYDSVWGLASAYLWMATAKGNQL